MNFSQFIGNTFEWFSWQIFGTMIDYLDLFLSYIGEIASALITYILEINPTFTQLMLNMKSAVPVLLVIGLSLYIGINWFLMKTDQLRLIPQKILFVFLAISSVPLVFGMGTDFVRNTAPVADKLFVSEASHNKIGLANSMTSVNLNLIDYLKNSKVSNPCGGYNTDGTLWWYKEGNTYDGRGTDGSSPYVQGSDLLLLGESKARKEADWRNAGLNPNSKTDVFPNGGGFTLAEAEANAGNGFIKGDEGAASTGPWLRYTTVACPTVYEDSPTDNGVISYYSIAPIWLTFCFALVLLFVAIMISFKVIDTIYEMLLSGSSLYLTAPLSVTNTGYQAYVTNLQEFGRNTIGIIAIISFTSFSLMLMGQLLGSGIHYIMDQIGISASQNAEYFFVSTLLRIVLLLGTGFFVINGSDFIKKLIGIDTGISSSYMGALATQKVASTIAHASGEVVGHAASGVKNTMTKLDNSYKQQEAQKRLNKAEQMPKGEDNYSKKAENKRKNLTPEQLQDYENLAQNYYDSTKGAKEEPFVKLSEEKQNQIVNDIISGKTMDQMLAKNENTFNPERDFEQMKNTFRNQESKVYTNKQVAKDIQKFNNVYRQTHQNNNPPKQNFKKR